MYTIFIFMHKRILKIQIALLLSTKTLAFSFCWKSLWRECIAFQSHFSLVIEGICFRNNVKIQISDVLKGGNCNIFRSSAPGYIRTKALRGGSGESFLEPLKWKEQASTWFYELNQLFKKHILLISLRELCPGGWPTMLRPKAKCLNFL